MKNRICTSIGIVMLAIWMLVARVQGDTISPSTRTLRFPRDGYCMGSLYVEDPCLGSEWRELGRDLSLPYGLDPRRVALGGDPDFVSLAQGDVAVPVGRNLKLLITLRPPADRNLPAMPGSREYKIFRMDRRREDPEDLSGLSDLDPNDLWGITINRLMPVGPADECVFEPLSRLTGLRVLELHRTGITDRGMEHLRSLRSLRALEFSWESLVGNRGLAVLKDLPNLEYVDLDTGATDAGFQYLAQARSLRWLRIRTGRVWGPGLAELARLPRLERLCIWGTSGVSDRHIQYIEGLTQLKSLTLWGVADGLTDASLASIGKLTNLEELYFIRTMPRFTSAGIAHLRNLRNLKVLEFAPPIDDEGLRHLADLPNLQTVASIKLTTESAKTLASLPNLRSLDVCLADRDAPQAISSLVALGSLEELHFTGAAAGVSLSNADIASLALMRRLKRLSLAPGESHVTDEGMASIAKLKELEYLNLGMAAVTKRGLNQLSGLTDLRTLDLNVFHQDEPTIDEIPLNLSALKNLKSLRLQGVELRDADLASLAGMEDLEWLALGGSFTEHGLRHLQGLHSLKLMRMNSVSCLSGEGLSSLAGLPKLTDLGLDGQITDTALTHLAGFPSLWSLTIQTDESVRPATKDRLWQALPTVEYNHVDPLPRFDPPRLETFLQQRRPVRSTAPRTSRRRR